MSGQSVVSIRPANQEVAQPGFVPSVTSSPANIYRQSIEAQSHDERRFSFVWRSPSANLVLSPLAMGRFQITVKAPMRMSRANLIGTLLGAVDRTIPPHNAASQALATAGCDAAATYRSASF